ncbi:MAG: virulence RhuM family protein [Bacteroidales bacterium]|jgi:hypothetical protein|nr:virulence RhuM family protein [Bacteroidales bacterium]
MAQESNILIYTSKNGDIKVDVLLEDETVWLSIEQMAMLFGKSKSTINEHILNIFNEKELVKENTMRKIGISEFSTKPTNYYNLDIIISVGYRVKSLQGTQFRIWATQRLREYIVKGFALNDERFEKGSSMNYFKELLERIRKIRISEKVFYQQIKDIYATSIDYNPNDETTIKFYKEVQNKLLWAISGKTAAELIYYRANSSLPMMGLTSTLISDKITKSDIIIGKNYLNEQEIKALELIVEQYLAYAESMANSHKVMYMKDWAEKLNMILMMNEKDILQDAGRISHELAKQKAEIEYNKYKENLLEEEHLNSIKQLDRDIKLLQHNDNRINN